MAEQKAKPAAKKAVATNTGSKVAAKPKTAKATLTAAAKKTPAKKTVAAEPRKTKVTAVKNAAVPAAKKLLGAKIKPKAAKLKSAATKKTAKPTPEERYRMVETEAYYIAERHGFQGRSDEHWAAAELEVAVRLGQ